jgi:hypothetical protein
MPLEFPFFIKELEQDLNAIVANSELTDTVENYRRSSFVICVTLVTSGELYNKFLC